MARMPDEFVDLTVTSPPYDSLRTYDGHKFTWDEFTKAATGLYRVTKHGGVVVWVVDDEIKNGNRSLSSFRQAIFLQEIGFSFYDMIVFIKKGGGLPHSRRYKDAHEMMFVMSKGKIKTVNLIADKKNTWGGTSTFSNKTVREINGELTDRKKYLIKDTGVRYNVWEYFVGNRFSEEEKITVNHPAKFPEALARDHIYSWSNEGDLIYDPFMGSGTTAKMAHLMKRNWIGSEISQEYVDLANKRIEPYLRQITFDL